MFDTGMLGSNCTACFRPLCTSGNVERLFLFPVVPGVPPALQAEDGEADDEAQQDQDEDDAACDRASRVHWSGTRGGHISTCCMAISAIS